MYLQEVLEISTPAAAHQCNIACRICSKTPSISHTWAVAFKSFSASTGVSFSFFPAPSIKILKFTSFFCPSQLKSQTTSRTVMHYAPKPGTCTHKFISKKCLLSWDLPPLKVCKDSFMTPCRCLSLHTYTASDGAYSFTIFFDYINCIFSELFPFFMNHCPQIQKTKHRYTFHTNLHNVKVNYS